MSDYSNVTYKLVKLTSKEMEWQKEGTTYSVGTWWGRLPALLKKVNRPLWIIKRISSSITLGFEDEII